VRNLHEGRLNSSHAGTITGKPPRAIVSSVNGIPRQRVAIVLNLPPRGTIVHGNRQGAALSRNDNRVIE
jgi:hypothetical protein